MIRERVLRLFVLLTLPLILVVGCTSDDDPADPERWLRPVSSELREGFFDLLSGDDRLRDAVLRVTAEDEPDLHAEITGDGVVTPGELRSTAESMNTVNGFEITFWTSAGDVDFGDPATIRNVIADMVEEHVVEYLYGVSVLRAALATDDADTRTVEAFGQVPAVRDLANYLEETVLFGVDQLLAAADPD